MKAVEPFRNLDDIQKIKDYLLAKSKRDYLMFILGINTTLRISDLLQLKAKDIQLNTHIRITEKKTGKKRKIYVHETIKAEIKDYLNKLKYTPNMFLFYSQKNKRKPIDRIQAWRIINDAVIECEIEGSYGTHSLRKTFAYHAYMATKDPALIMDELNHTDWRSTKRYIGINQDNLDELHKKVVL